MLLPLVGFVMGCVIFSVLGRVVLAVVASFLFSIANLQLFVMGACLGALTLEIAYGWIFADSNDELTKTWTIVGVFARNAHGSRARWFRSGLAEYSFPEAT